MLMKGNVPVIVDSIKVSSDTLDLERGYNFGGTGYTMSVSVVDSFNMTFTGGSGRGNILAQPLTVTATDAN